MLRIKNSNAPRLLWPATDRELGWSLMIWLTKNLKREDMLLHRVVSEAACGSQIISAGLPQPVLPRLTCPTPNQDPYPPLFNGILLVLAHHLLWLRPSGSFWSECLIPPGSYLGSTLGEAFWVSKGPEAWELFSRLRSACCSACCSTPPPLTKVYKRSNSEALLPVGGPGFQTISHTPDRPTQRQVIIEEPIITNLDFDMTGIGQKPQI